MKIELSKKAILTGVLAVSMPFMSYAASDASLAVSMKNILDQSPLGCGLHEGELATSDLSGTPADHFVAHFNASSSLVSATTGTDVVDTVKALVIDDADVTGYKVAVLIEALGGLQANNTDVALREIYDSAEAIAKRIVPAGTDSAIKEAVTNSNVEDINIAIVDAVARSGTHSLDDIVSEIAKTGGASAAKANSLLASK